MLTYAGECWRMRVQFVVHSEAENRSNFMPYAHVCSRMLTYAHVCWRFMQNEAENRSNSAMLTYADVCCSMLTYAAVCRTKQRTGVTRRCGCSCNRCRLSCNSYERAQVLLYKLAYEVQLSLQQLQQMQAELQLVRKSAGTPI
jgi:hypothetical protein